MTTPPSRPETLLAEVGFLMSAVRAGVVDAVNAELASLDLRVREYSVLAVSGDTDEVTQRALSSLLRLDPSRVVALLDTLEKRDLVQRTPHPTDRRTNVVRVTERGRQLRERGREAAVRGEQVALNGLSEAERDFLVALLRRLALHEQPDLVALVIPTRPRTDAIL